MAGPERPTASSITDDQLDALHAERDVLAAQVATQHRVLIRLQQMATAWRRGLPRVIDRDAVADAVLFTLEPALPATEESEQPDSGRRIPIPGIPECPNDCPCRRPSATEETS